MPRNASLYSYCRLCNRESSRKRRQRIKSANSSTDERAATSSKRRGVQVIDPASQL